jgi:LysR family cyn operon transcriptional activator
MDRRELFPRSLWYLIAIGQHGSFTRAAEVLNVSQPTLSQQIKQLEVALGAELIDRTQRRIRLTDAGEIFLRHAQRALGELKAGARALQDVQSLTRGSLRLGWTPVTDCLTCSLLATFNMNFPGITLTALELSQHDVEASLLDSQIDVGIVFSTPSSGETGSGGALATLTLFEDTLALTVGNRHRLANRTAPLDMSQLGDVSLVLLNCDFALRRLIDVYCGANGIEPRIAMETNAVSVIIEMVRLGDLSTILPKTLVQTCPGLHSIPTKPTLPRHKVSLIWNQGGFMSAAARAFIDLATEWSISRMPEYQAPELA